MIFELKNGILWSMKHIAKNEKEMVEIGLKTASGLKGGDILCFYGDLGAGKTTFIKGLARGLGVSKKITSPTFALMNIYNTKTLKHENIKTFVHIDTYRLKDKQELTDIGALDYIGAPDTITAIEWPEKIKALLKNKKCVDVRIRHLRNGREIEITNF